MRKEKAETFFAVLTCVVSVCLVMNLICQNRADGYQDEASDCQNAIVENMAIMNCRQTAMFSLMTMTELRQFIKLGVLLSSNVLTNDQMRAMIDKAFAGAPKNEQMTEQSELSNAINRKIQDIRTRLADNRMRSRRWGMVADIALYLGLVLNLISLAPLLSVWRQHHEE